MENAGEGADGNYSYWIDGGDLTVWQNNYGAGHDPSELAAVVVDTKSIEELAAVESTNVHGVPSAASLDSFALPGSVFLDPFGGLSASGVDADGSTAADVALADESEFANRATLAGAVGARDSASRYAPPRRLQFAASDDYAELVLALDAAARRLALGRQKLFQPAVESSTFLRDLAWAAAAVMAFFAVLNNIKIWFRNTGRGIRLAGGARRASSFDSFALPSSTTAPAAHDPSPSATRLYSPPIVA